MERVLPPNAIVFASWQSGSVRYHGRRMTIDWGALDPAWLDAPCSSCEPRLRAVVLVDGGEPSFRAKFGSGVAGRLDWPPVFDMWARVRIFRVRIVRSTRGKSVHTEYEDEDCGVRAAV